MSNDDQAYFLRRAEAELSLAQEARVPEVVQVHYDLAEAYLAKLDPDLRPEPVTKTAAAKH